MQATKQNPIYKVFVISTSQSKKYEITNTIESLNLEERNKQIAAYATITLMNTTVEGVELIDAIEARDRVFIYADDGSKKDEVFRGFVWTKQYKKSTSDKTIELRCYDNLIYFQNSQESEYFSGGNSTKSVVASICKKWGIQLNYQYESITHSKLVLRGTLSDIFTKDILDLVKDRTGVPYVIISTKDIMEVKAEGSNTQMYTIAEGNNAISATQLITMDDMVTQVKILGKADDNDKKPVEATVKGDTDKYGTLQQIIDRSENTALADAKKEAENIIKKKGYPAFECNVTAPDIPWIRKGDQIQIKVGEPSEKLIVVGISHSISRTKKVMDLTLKMVGDDAPKKRKIKKK